MSESVDSHQPIEKLSKIEYDGHHYYDVPHIRQLIERAEEIKKYLPTVSDENIRLWRGNREGEVGNNPSFTSSLVGIALPFRDAYGGQLSYIDISKIDAEKYLCHGCVAPNAEFLLPPGLANQAKIIKER